MSTFTIRPEDAKNVIAEDMRRRKAGFLRGIRRAAEHGRAYLVHQTKRMGKDYTGQFRASWRVVPRADGGCDLINDAPHAGIIELGARPHPVSIEGQEAIREWVRVKLLGISAEEADSNAETEQITQAIVWRIQRYGQPATYLVRSSLPTLRRFVKEDVERSIAEEMARPMGGVR